MIMDDSRVQSVLVRYPVILARISSTIIVVMIRLFWCPFFMAHIMSGIPLYPGAHPVVCFPITTVIRMIARAHHSPSSSPISWHWIRVYTPMPAMSWRPTPVVRRATAGARPLLLLRCPSVVHAVVRWSRTKKATTIYHHPLAPRSYDDRSTPGAFWDFSVLFRRQSSPFPIRHTALYRIWTYVS